MHLALLARNWELANQMVEEGFDVYEKTSNEISPLQLFAGLSLINNDNMALKIIKKLTANIAVKIDNVDLIFENGESVADILIKNEELVGKVINQSHDPLFSFVKEGADLFVPLNNPEKTHIAISHSAGFWSTGVWSFARLVMKNHPDIVFHLVTKNILDEGGDKFLKQLDGFINPSAAEIF